MRNRRKNHLLSCHLCRQVYKMEVMTFFKSNNIDFYSKYGSDFIKGSTAIISKFFAQPSPLRSKTTLENKEPAGISAKFMYLIWQNNEILHDNSKLFSVRSYRGKIGVYSIFVKPELSWKSTSVNKIFSWIQI